MLTLVEWEAEGEKRFGKDTMNWKFVCPSCGHVWSKKDWKDAGAGEGEVAFSCVGRHLLNPKDAFGNDGGPCNYAGGGLFRINPVRITDIPGGEDAYLFDFA